MSKEAEKFGRKRSLRQLTVALAVLSVLAVGYSANARDRAPAAASQALRDVIADSVVTNAEMSAQVAAAATCIVDKGADVVEGWYDSEGARFSLHVAIPAARDEAFDVEIEDCRQQHLDSALALRGQMAQRSQPEVDRRFDSCMALSGVANAPSGVDQAIRALASSQDMSALAVAELCEAQAHRAVPFRYEAGL